MLTELKTDLFEKALRLNWETATKELDEAKKILVAPIGKMWKVPQSELVTGGAAIFIDHPSSDGGISEVRILIPDQTLISVYRLNSDSQSESGQGYRTQVFDLTKEDETLIKDESLSKSIIEKVLEQIEESLDYWPRHDFF